MADPAAEITIRNISRESPTRPEGCENSRPASADTSVKYKCTITSERFAQLRRIVDDALKEHKIFTIRGGWQILRRALLRRNWIEKMVEPQGKSRSQCQQSQTASCVDDLGITFPLKQSWETQAAHITKCERMIISRLLQIHDADFYWNTRRDTQSNDTQLRLNCNKLISRFSRSLFTSKEGLCLLLQQMYWHNEPGVANVNFPRCYVLGFPDHFQNFVEDFRLTACTSLLKYIVNLYETEDSYAVQSPEGSVPYSAFQFAVDRLNEFLAIKKHMDIDVDIPQVPALEWDTFLLHSKQIVHQKHFFLEDKAFLLPVLIGVAKTILKKVAVYWPQFSLDGMKNIWIMKPGNKCRGRGIQLIKEVKDVERIMELKLKYVVQKYIERPLIIYNTKFDIRQWFMVTSVQPLTIWMYRESYLRFSSQNFNLENFHEALHLTNHAVQCKYKNTQDRDKALPDDNMWDCYTFQGYLKSIGHGNKWETVIYPGMKESIIGSMLSCQDTMDRRPNTFELYGADFIIAEDFQPWLLEINSSPDLSSSTTVTARMCPQCLEDLVKVVIDKRKEASSDTGFFDLIYKQNFPRPPAYLGMSLSVRGRRVFKKHKSRRDNKENDIIRRADSVSSKNKKEASRLVAPDATGRSRLSLNNNQHHSDADLKYKGPRIADLIEEIHRSIECDDFEQDDGSGYQVVQPISKTMSALTARKKPKVDQKGAPRVSIKVRIKGTKRASSPIREPSVSEICTMPTTSTTMTSMTTSNNKTQTAPNAATPPTFVRIGHFTDQTSSSALHQEVGAGAVEIRKSRFSEWRSLATAGVGHRKSSGSGTFSSKNYHCFGGGSDKVKKEDLKFNKEYLYVPSMCRFSKSEFKPNKQGLLTVGGQGYALRRFTRPHT